MALWRDEEMLPPIDSGLPQSLEVERHSPLVEQAEIDSTTSVKKRYFDSEVKIEIIRTFLGLTVVIATSMISIRNTDFANNQAGLILSGIAGGLFGVSQARPSDRP